MKFRSLLPLCVVGMVICGFTVPRPLVCDVPLYKNWDEHTSVKKMDGELRKGKRHHSPPRYKLMADIQFAKAYLGYMKTGMRDTVLFNDVILLYKKYYTKVDTRSSKEETLYRVALCYYYLGDQKSAQLWLAKDIKARGNTVPGRCPELWLTKSLLKADMTDSAESVLSNYCLNNTMDKDSLRKLIHIDILNGN